eukprot:8046701-Prorocentrum_lima.AAC.1
MASLACSSQWPRPSTDWALHTAPCLVLSLLLDPPAAEGDFDFGWCRPDVPCQKSPSSRCPRFENHGHYVHYLSAGRHASAI